MIEPPTPSRNPIEQLVYLLRKGAKITRSLRQPVAGNDLPYCYVEITVSTGTQYVIHAYEKEDAELHEMARKIVNQYSKS